MININDLLKIDDKKKQIKKEIYTKIIEQFSSKIKQSSELGHKQVFLTIPLFLLGYPVFDRLAACRYVTRQFANGGYTTDMISDFDIYISWSRPKKKKEIVHEDEDDLDLPNLMNLKKIANKYRGGA
tara:strand:+ start:879 stop:1259 length:381 start_codon:yes stop_codon:yes gene_type:complete